jgi:hypothetical protein
LVAIRDGAKTSLFDRFDATNWLTRTIISSDLSMSAVGKTGHSSWITSVATDPKRANGSQKVRLLIFHLQALPATPSAID